jgi:hypothetical protein
METATEQVLHAIRAGAAEVHVWTRRIHPQKGAIADV